jgi:hypothetical protein
MDAAKDTEKDAKKKFDDCVVTNKDAGGKDHADCKAADTQYKADQGDYTKKKTSYDDAKKLSDASDVLLKKAQKDKTDADSKRQKE